MYKFTFVLAENKLPLKFILYLVLIIIWQRLTHLPAIKQNIESSKDNFLYCCLSQEHRINYFGVCLLLTGLNTHFQSSKGVNSKLIRPQDLDFTLKLMAVAVVIFSS